MYLPTFLRRKMGFSTHAMVSLPVLNPKTCINRDFDSFELMKSDECQGSCGRKRHAAC